MENKLLSGVLICLCPFAFCLPRSYFAFMLGAFSRRLLPVLQLTRMALVFTAIADGFCSILLLAKARSLNTGFPVEHFLDPWRILAMAGVSVGLYGFGMSLNDIIDRRRDQQIASHRPLPSGRIGLSSAYAVCILLAFLAITAGFYYAVMPHGVDSREGDMSLLLIVLTGFLIIFYDTAGKYLVAPGLLTLGLIRFFHAVIPAPQLPLLWHPLLLLNHVTILSLLAYAWEEKRPALTAIHWWAVLGGVAFVDVASIGLVWTRRGELWLDRGLAIPLTAACLFAAMAILIRRHSVSSRDAGQSVMFYGLLWLILYDAAFVAGYVSPMYGVALLLLLPVAYLSVQFIRWWTHLLIVSHPPGFKRAEH
jgi:4-hydroxybenzoate polyprenyltransferase